MTEENTTPEEHPSPDSPSKHDELEDQIHITQDVIEGLLQMLGEAWARIAELEKPAAESPTKKTAAEPTATEPTLEEALAAAEAAEKDETPLHGILIVDDSRLMQVRLKSLIEPLGYEVVGIANDGMAGWLKAVTLSPKLVILDYNMPEMNGLECLRIIRTKRHDIKVIICAADLSAELSQQFLHTGADGMLSKPIQLDKFISTVKECMTS